MVTINSQTFKRGVNYFGCPKTCDNLQIAVKIEFECTHPHQAFDYLEQMLDGQENYEITFSNNETCTVLIYPEEIKFSSNSSNEVEEIIEEVEDLEELEEVE